MDRFLALVDLSRGLCGLRDAGTRTVRRGSFIATGAAEVGHGAMVANEK